MTGKLHWVEHEPWSQEPRSVYWSKAKVAFLYLSPLLVVPLVLYVLRKQNVQV